MAKETRSFTVIGLGAFGSAVVTELARFGNKVMGIDLDEKRVTQMSNALDSCVILVTTNEAALREAGVDQYDVALIAIGRDIQASILTLILNMPKADHFKIEVSKSGSAVVRQPTQSLDSR